MEVVNFNIGCIPCCAVKVDGRVSIASRGVNGVVANGRDYKEARKKFLKMYHEASIAMNTLHIERFGYSLN